MRALLSTLALAALALASPALADPLADYAWTNRVVLVFAARADDPRLVRQTGALEARPVESCARDLVVLAVTRDGVSASDGSVRDPAALRARHGIGPEDFTVLLVGKDGGVKLRAAEPVTADRLYGRIDGMPMRRVEARQGVPGRCRAS